jgi:AraC-like DNA-binding protein
MLLERADNLEYERVHADLLRCFPELVRELGGQPEELARQAGVQLPASGAGATALSYRSWVNVLEHAAVQLRCPDFGLRLARLQGGGNVFGPIGLVMKHSRTFGEALEYVVAHNQAHSLAADIRLEREQPAHGAFVGHEILLDRLPSRRQALEQALLLAHLIAQELTGGRARVREARFRHRPISSLRTYRAYFEGPVCFQANADGVVYDDQDLRCPIVERDPQRYAAATSAIERQLRRVARPLRAQVRALVARSLSVSDCSHASVSRTLGVHPRTLRRRLRDEDTSFEDIKDDVRRDLTLRYLRETELPLTLVAEKLGYSEQSVLTRSCKRWFSASPSQLRAHGG